ncbi:hypothetical protein XENOCAPTIV_021688 [Xenoophorus captivus]|uniref:Uncharacterized protein n=1 Tax=Xenoophorus captivus TaxID=1517983 RepID=A0ABV0S4N6_9TELE
MRSTSSPAKQREGAPRQHFLWRKEDVGSVGCAQGAQPGEQTENGAEPPHAPSAPAAVERAEPPDRPADVSLPPPSAAEPSDHWRSLGKLPLTWQNMNKKSKTKV